MAAAKNKTIIGVIGGSGVYDIDGLEDLRWQAVDSPFGKPSDELLFGRLAGVDLVFLPVMAAATRYRQPTSTSGEYRCAQARGRHRYHLR